MARRRRGRARGDRVDRLVARTQRRLAAFTLLLVSTLLIAVGAATAIVATRLMDENVDRALAAAAAAAISPGDDGDDQGHAPGVADTFVLFLDAGGQVVGNPSGVTLTGLPDTDALATAQATGRDLRDGTFGGVHVRVLTVPAPGPTSDDHHTTPGFVQAGIRLTLHEQQEQELRWTITWISVLGLIGAALVTWLVTRRALVPIRAAFMTERRFVAAASHELRTPVAIVRASAELLEREGHVAEEGQPLVSDIVSETDRLGRLIGDMLALASAEAGSVTLVRQPLELTGWLEGLARRLLPLVHAHGLTLRTEIPSAPVPVLGDEDRLSQILLVLVDNAIEHSPAAGTITLGLATDADDAAIAVTDAGPGVPPAERERMFEPFARLPGTRRSTSGSGLGLPIARELARRHDGSLTIEDAPGGGARVVLRLPVHVG